MYIYAANGTAIGEITHNVNNETIVYAFRHALENALPNGTDTDMAMHDLCSIVNIPQDCPNYAERLNFAEYHIQAVYKLACAYGRAKAALHEVIPFKAGDKVTAKYMKEANVGTVVGVYGTTVTVEWEWDTINHYHSALIHV